MSLRKDLVAAFRHPEPSYRENAYVNVDLEPEHGYMWKKVAGCVVFNSAGEMVDLERPPWRSGGKRRRSLLLVPYTKLSKHSASSGFLWGQSSYALGIGRSSISGNVTINEEYFSIFKTFHRVALDSAKSVSLQAFKLFLKRWGPESAADFEKLAEVAGGALVFRFRYEDCFLHESHSARVIWARLLNSTGVGTNNQEQSVGCLDEVLG